MIGVRATGMIFALLIGASPLIAGEAAPPPTVPAPAVPDALAVDGAAAPDAAPAAVVLSAPKGDGPNIRSLFFKREEMERIRRAIDIYERSRLKALNAEQQTATPEEEDFLSKLAAGLDASGPSDQEKQAAALQEKARNFVFPKYYLESFIFHSENDWVVWMGGKKFTPSNRELGDIEVVRVSGGGVDLLWHPSAMNRVMEVVRSTDPQMSGIFVDEASGVVGFTMQMNQTFLTDQMKIVEGKMIPPPPPRKAEPKPEEVKKEGEAQQAPAETQTSAPPAPASPYAPVATTPPPAPAAPTTGLEGIRRMYDQEIPAIQSQR